ADDTIIVFTSDHGEWLGEHLKYGKGYPGHDCVGRVPLIVRWPAGDLESGRASSDLVEGVDVVPTLLECAGIPVPPHIQGRSLTPTLRGEEATPKTCALMEMHGWKTVRTRDHRYVLRASGDEMLFDLRTDPMAYTDLADDPAAADALADCRLQLARRVIEIESPLPRSWQY
ncbi:sulfatase-like hydrolase/transferase, partial [Candidatus Poribacteria bacterium]|nr:sulfatase-like hydrolase/transferase [Candidatus Poribacteria bacterium]